MSSYVKNYTLYYSSVQDEAYSAEGTREVFGFDPTSYDSSRLPELGLYQVNQNEPAKSDCLYTLAANYTINGNFADQSWTATPKALASAKEHGETCVKRAADISITENFNTDGYSMPFLIAVSSLTPASRASEFESKLLVMSNKTTILGDQLTAINAAVDVDEISYVVFPSTSITGTLSLTRAGNDLTIGEFDSLVGADGEDFELVLPNATVQWDNATNRFPATAGCWSGTFTFTLRYGGFYDVLSGTTGSGEVDHAINWQPTITPLPLNS